MSNVRQPVYPAALSFAQQLGDVLAALGPAPLQVGYVVSPAGLDCAMQSRPVSATYHRSMSAIGC